MSSDLWAWLSLVALGVFHGLNPAMGWLFAVALGLQEQRLTAVLAALPPIALGHAAAIAVVAVVTALLGTLLPEASLLTFAGLLLLAFTGWRIWKRFRHPRTRFRASRRELAIWSFLMASAHGAGLMVAPLLAVLLRSTNEVVATTNHVEHLQPFAQSVWLAFAAVLVHTASMFLTMAVVAVIVFRELGVELLRRAWVNVDLLWVAVLGLTGALTLALGLRGFLS
uniref:Uncharacterized protein n=1 Tax=Thermomicrobium roseum TaxID=500 RepID=A0A7C5VYY3_THERO